MSPAPSRKWTYTAGDEQTDAQHELEGTMLYIQVAGRACFCVTQEVPAPGDQYGFVEHGVFRTLKEAKECAEALAVTLAPTYAQAVAAKAAWNAECEKRQREVQP